MRPGQFLLEIFFPWRRLERLERELDAEERRGARLMLNEWHDFQNREALREYRQPYVFAKLMKKAE